ncbi:MAG: porin [Alphaproteobacteria bacterium]
MKKILLGTSAIIAMAAMGASAHTRDGLVDTTPTNFELTIKGEVSAYQALTSITAEDKDGKEIGSEGFFGQDYSADVDFIAKTHIRDWDIEARVELDYNSNKNFDADEIYMDFKHASIGTFRLGRAPAPSDVLSLEADLPGENWDDVGGLNEAFASTFGGLGNSRFADDANIVGYFTPKFGNVFQFGIAYIFGTQTDDELISGGSYLDWGLDKDGLANKIEDDAVEVAAKLEGEYAGFTYGLSAAYRQYLGSDNMYWANNTLTDYVAIESRWTAGVKLGYMGFTWITTYGETNYGFNGEGKSPWDGANDWGVRTALTYAWDRWEVGAAYEAGQAYAGTDETITSSLIEAGASFKVFTGMSVHAAAAYAMSEHDELASVHPGAKADGIQLRTGIDLSW